MTANVLYRKKELENRSKFPEAFYKNGQTPERKDGPQ